MMPIPFVSIVITPWNSGIYLTRCLEHLSAQSFQDFEIIVVDNGSTDGSLDGLEDKWPGLKFRIQYLVKNNGYTVANNFGARLACGRWLALLNADAFPAVDWLENLLQAAENHPEFSFFASRQIQANAPYLLDGCGDAYHVSGLAWRTYYNFPSDTYGLQPSEVFSACGAAALYDRVAFLQVMGFDEDFFSYYEDVDIGFRLRLRGNRCFYVPQASVDHIGSVSLGQRSDFAFYHVHRNFIWSFVQNMPSRLLWRYLPAHLMANLIYLVNYTLRGKSRVLWHAKLDALKGMQRALQKRKVIQNSVVVSEHDLVNLMERNWLDPYLIGYRARAVMKENGQGE
jgi:GT2 family glycosyltransferase